MQTEKDRIEKEKVIITLFLCSQDEKGKTIFSTRSAIFNRYEQVSDILGWANMKKAPKDRVLKLEMTQNER